MILRCGGLRVQSARQTDPADLGEELVSGPARPAHEVRKRQVRLTPEQVDSLVRLYAEGSSFPDLIERFGINESTVAAHLRSRRVPKRAYRKLHGVQLQEARRMYEAGGSLRSVAEDLRLSREAVRSGLMAAGVEMRAVGRRPSSPP